MYSALLVPSLNGSLNAEHLAASLWKVATGVSAANKTKGEFLIVAAELLVECGNPARNSSGLHYSHSLARGTGVRWPSERTGWWHSFGRRWRPRSGDCLARLFRCICCAEELLLPRRHGAVLEQIRVVTAGE